MLSNDDILLDKRLNKFNKAFQRDLDGLFDRLKSAYGKDSYETIVKEIKQAEKLLVDDYIKKLRKEVEETVGVAYIKEWDDYKGLIPKIIIPKTPYDRLKKSLNATRKFIRDNGTSKLMTFEKVLKELGVKEKNILKLTREGLKRAIESGKGIDVGVKIMKDFLTDSSPLHLDKGKFNYEFKRVIRTETLRARSVGMEEAYTDVDPIYGIVKVYIATKDRRTRYQHKTINGQVADKDGYFRYPDGTKTKQPRLSGVARQDIMCRCSTRAEVR